MEIVRAQGLPLRSGYAGSMPFDTSLSSASDASLVPHPYILAVTWPWSKCVPRLPGCVCVVHGCPELWSGEPAAGLTPLFLWPPVVLIRSGEFYQTNVPINATQAPVWQARACVQCVLRFFCIPTSVMLTPSPCSSLFTSAAKLHV